MLQAKFTFLPESGLKPINQIHSGTKWRSVVLHPFKVELYPLPPNEVGRMVIKEKSRKKKKNQQSTNDQSNDNNLEMNDTSATTSKQSKPKERDTGMVVIEGAVVDADPSLITSDDEDSNYVDPNFDLNTLNNLDDRTIRSGTRDKNIFAPKPKATTIMAKKLRKKF